MTVSRLHLAAVTSALAPAALVGGFSLGAARQPARYDSLRDTISALAGRGATDRWIMTAAFVLLGLCHLGTAYGLRRPVLALGGAATMLLAVTPEPAHGSSSIHAVVATIALVALSVWALQDHLLATALLVALLVWFLVALQADAGVGLAERTVTVAQAVWPIMVVQRALRMQTRSAQ